MNKLLLGACSAVAALVIGSAGASAHGCHREPMPDKFGWHRHVGPYCKRIDLPPPHDGPQYYEGGPRHRYPPPPPPPPPPRCREECVGVGPLRFCEKKCY